MHRNYIQYAILGILRINTAHTKLISDHQFSIALSICALHRGPYLLMAHITIPLSQASSPKAVNNHPLPMASIKGLAIIPPTQLKIFRIKLFTATPELLFLGMNSVNIVVDKLNITMEPSPKKKFATAATAQ